ncbi:SDR family oxidoreductase [Paucibacter sp. R3-3]|uniref:SDR family oxidoreductase n=1 Tax=Roseateles agri TaxID=3098619 RepID=A0ABU5DPM9_9BURK|nr:SDR family oxidoreductase [Paucibacter sp. R3-3]MDY0748059.1 SDR family oxidoreductase [Paucibacter sp. R3-3]
MSMRDQAVVVGASGIVGQAVLRAFAETPGWDAVGVSRRLPVNVPLHARHVSVDLTDRDACASVFGAMKDATHLVYAAVNEKPGLVAGWVDRDQMQLNLGMLRNVLEPLQANARGLRHVTLMQGGKAYGIHLDPNLAVPARERWPRHPHDNFYWLQEDYLRERQPHSGWHWTVLRPRLVFGDGLGSNMNPLPAIGVYAALQKARGLPLCYPGGPPRVYQAVDADLIGRACVWAARSIEARNEIFNLANGDEFVWQNVWPVIADAFGMAVGEPQQQHLAETMPPLEAQWAKIVGQHGLQAPPRFREFVGQGFAYADFQLNTGKTGPQPPSLVSTIKIRKAGFTDCMDTEDMLRRWIQRYQELRWLPPRDG